MKRVCLLLGAALTMAECGGDNGPSSTVTSVVITGDSVVALHATHQLTATALAGNTPIDPTGLTFLWMTSDSTKLRVSQTGLVTGVSLGSASITVTAVPQVTDPVSSSPHAMRSRIGRIVFQPFDVVLAPNDTLILNADARDGLNSSLTGITFTWVSRSPAIVTVADSGIHKAIVAAVGTGTTRIVATADGITDSLTATVQVSASVPIRNWIVRGSLRH